MPRHKRLTLAAEQSESLHTVSNCHEQPGQYEGREQHQREAGPNENHAENQDSTQPEPNLPPAEPKQSRHRQLIALLHRPEGATLSDMTTATGWQAHSVRGVMSGVIKKKLGLDIVSEKLNGGRIYRII